jgi:hypothetical protein
MPLLRAKSSCRHAVPVFAAIAAALLGGCGAGIVPGSGGSGTEAVLTVAPASIAFGAVVAGSSSTAQPVTATNTGNALLTFSGIVLSGTSAAQFSQTTNCGGTLAVGASCTTTVLFTPTAVATATASLSFASNASNGTQTVALGGTGTAGPAPILTVTPASLAFGSVAAGFSSGAQRVTATNTGTATLTFSGISVTGPEASQFITTALTCGSTLAAGASCMTNVVFTPNTVGTDTASLSFASDASNGTQTVALSGTATPATLATLMVTPATLAFGPVAMGSSSAAQTVTATNIGTATLTFTGITLSGTSAGQFAQTTNCGTTLAVGATCTTMVVFTPTAVATASATLSFASNASNGTQTVELGGMGAAAPAPVVMLSPAILGFGNVNLGVSETLNLVLTNIGTATLNVGTLAINGSGAAAFSEADTCAGAAVAPAGMCQIQVTFTPTTAGVATASLVITDNAANSPQTVPLAGTGVGAPLATIIPATLNFGSATLNVATSIQTAVLQNTGTAPLVITGVTTGGTGAAAFTESDNCTGTIAVNGACTISVSFKPTAVASYAATVSVADNAVGSPQTLTLTGSGAGASATDLSCTSLAFGEVVKLTPSATQSCTLKNAGTAALTITGFSMTGTNATSFAQTNMCGASVAVGASCTITVTATPQAIGLLTATLNVADNAPGSPQTAALTASGVKAHYQGLITMNNAKTIAGEPDNTMEELNAHPDIYLGAVIHATWAQLEPSEGVFSNAAIEAAFANIAAYNAKYPAGPHVTGKLRVEADATVPAWLLADTGSVVTTDGTLAAFWSPEYTKQWRALIVWLASVYDLDERMQEIAISSCSSSTDEPFVLVHGTTNTPALIAAGYTDTAYHNCLNGAGTDYAPFQFTPIDYTFNAEGSLQVNNVYYTDQNASVVIMDAFRAQYPVRSIVANHGLGNPSTTGQTTIYANFATLYNQAEAMPPPRNYGLEFQTFNQQVDWDTSIAQAESLHATEVEIWDTQAAGGQAPLTATQLQGYAAGIAKD